MPPYPNEMVPLQIDRAMVETVPTAAGRQPCPGVCVPAFCRGWNDRHPSSSGAMSEQ
jgi:hypothetical protein